MAVTYYVEMPRNTCKLCDAQLALVCSDGRFDDKTNVKFNVYSGYQLYGGEVPMSLYCPYCGLKYQFFVKE